MKYEYPLTSKYVRDWGPIDALREFGANALDAERVRKAKATITYDAKRQAVLFKNDGVKVPKSALLLGGTDKENNAETIGTFGEGMKIGFLVCSREGLLVTVRNGRDEKWSPRIEFSEKWGSQILQLDVTTAKRQVDSFEIEVLGVSMGLWEELQNRFLVLRPPARKIETSEGDVLVDSDMVGKIYSKGVFVQSVTDYIYGYDLPNLELNRDRQFTSSVDSHIAEVWRARVDGDLDSVDELFDIMQRGTPEGNAIRAYGGYKLVEVLSDAFVKRYPGKYIARTTEEARQFEHYGIHAVVVSSDLYALLARRLPTYSEFRAEHKFDVNHTFSFDELSAQERDNYSRAMDVLERAGVVKAQDLRVSIVDFMEDRIRGLHEGADIKISRKLLKNMGHLLVYLIHEFAHDAGEDGTKSHIDAEEEAMARVLNLLAS